MDDNDSVGTPSAELAHVCPFCKSDPEALADAHEEGWRAGREHERRFFAERMAQAWKEGERAGRSNAEADRPGRDYAEDGYPEAVIENPYEAPRFPPE